ncbi:MAG TPA: ParB/RepB/Spo0J family partition protein [Acidisarcina sp.]|nr:ParB/RepB/Spo0J family partition protein [Acidisarcina sp.]
MTTTIDLQVRQIPVALIVPSPTNPRKSIDESQLRELAESIQSGGIKVPLQLRPLGDGYEILGGERRWRAAKMLGLDTVPAIVRELNDADARELQLVENLQRADLSPMEEAEAYEMLIQRAADEGLVIPDDALAHKVGKPAAYVRSRRRLLELIPEARECAREGLIAFGAALLIAKLTPQQQVQATHRALNMHNAGKMLPDVINEVREEKRDAESGRAKMIAQGKSPDDYCDAFEPISERVLRAWIEDHILLDLKSAPWPLDAQNMHPVAGACVDCPKRTGADQALFADLTAQADVCTDPDCFSEKKKTFIHITAEAAEKSGKPLLKLSMQANYMGVREGQKSYKKGQWLSAKPGECGSVQKGITDEGELLDVCVDPKCKVHPHIVTSPAVKAAPGPKQESWEVRQKREKAEEAAWLVAELPIRKAVYAAIRRKAKGSKLLRVAMSRLFEESNVWELSEFLGWVQAEDKHRHDTVVALLKQSKDDELEGYICDLAVGPLAIPDWGNRAMGKDRRELWALAESLGIDAEAIENQVSGKPDQKRPAKKAPAKKAAPKKQSTAKKTAGKKGGKK